MRGRVSFAHLLLSAAAAAGPAAPQVLHVVCAPTNDIWEILTQLPPATLALARHDTVAAALAAASPGDALAALADGAAGGGGGAWPAAEWAALSAARLSGAYVELPASLPGNASGGCTAPTPAWYFDRLVSLGAALGPAAPAGTLLTAQGAHFCAYDESHLAASALAYAHVAGSTHAVFGLPPNASMNPVLFALPTPSLSGGAPPAAPQPTGLVAAVALSCVVRCR